MKLMNSRTEGAQDGGAHGVPALPGGGVVDAGREAGLSGPRRAGLAGSARLRVTSPAFARLGPPSPTLIFSKRSLEPRWGNADSGADLCGKKCGLLRESPRSFTKVRTDQARKSAMLRIVTGGTLFYEM